MLITITTIALAKPVTIQKTNQLLLMNPLGGTLNANYAKTIGKKHGIRINPNNGKISIIWGAANIKKISPSTLSRLSEISNDDNVIIGIIEKNKISWNGILNGTYYNWTTVERNYKQNIELAIMRIKHHILPKSNYLKVTLKINQKPNKWPTIKSELTKACYNSKWLLKSTSIDSITASAMISNQDCLKNFGFIETKHYESENI